MVHPFKWLRPDLVPPAPFLQCKPHLTPGGSGVLADPARIDEKFRKASLLLSLWMKGIPALRNSILKLLRGYLFCLTLSCPGWLVRCLLMFFIVRVLLPAVSMVGVGEN